MVLPRPDTYAPLFTDLLTRLGVPFRLHPSLPLSTGRATRALLLLLRCRGLGRPEVMEFLTFAPVPFAELLGAETTVDLAAWDQVSRDAGIVSDLARWMVGLRAYAETERREAGDDEWRRARAHERATLAESLLRLVELLSSTLESLAGFAAWPEWSERLQAACDQWIGPEDDREALARRDRRPGGPRVLRWPRRVARRRARPHDPARVGAPAHAAAHVRRHPPGRAGRGRGPALPRAGDPGTGRGRLPGSAPAGSVPPRS